MIKFYSYTDGFEDEKIRLLLINDTTLKYTCFICGETPAEYSRWTEAVNVKNIYEILNGERCSVFNEIGSAETFEDLSFKFPEYFI